MKVNEKKKNNDGKPFNNQLYLLLSIEWQRDRNQCNMSLFSSIKKKRVHTFT